MQAPPAERRHAADLPPYLGIWAAVIAQCGINGYGLLQVNQAGLSKKSDPTPQEVKWHPGEGGRLHASTHMNTRERMSSVASQQGYSADELGLVQAL